jgi:thymidylate synthase
MNNLDKQYTALLQDILDNGVTKQDRTGTGTLSVFGRQIRHKMSEGFPLLTTKKMPFKTIVTELLWFLRGDTNIKYLVDNNCNIWNGDAWKNYQNKASKEDFLKDGVLRYEEFINKIKTDDEFAKKWGNLGPIYGKQWRNWSTYEEVSWGMVKVVVDQIANLINDLKTNPDSRRLMVNAWNVGELDQMTLPPCHYGFQVYTRELSFEERKELMVKYTNDNSLLPIGFSVPFGDESNKKYLKVCDSYNIPTRAISLMWNQRSVDTFLGLPFNIASYGLLLEIIAKEVNMVPDELIGDLGDTHLYLNHIEQANEQIGRELTIEERGSLYRKQQNLPDDVSLIGTDRDAHRVFDDYGITKRTREPFPLPKLLCLDEYHYLTDEELVGVIPFTEKIKEFRPDFFTMGNYQSHATIKAPLSN